MGSVLGVLAFIVLLLFAIFFHEFGHYITARWADIKVSRFFIGFGPTIWSYRRGRVETVVGPGGLVETRPETEYGVKALPLGGFVKVVGMSPFEEVPAADEPRSFDAAPIWKRAIVLSAGSATHFVTAFLLMFVIFTIVGVPKADDRTTTIGAIQPEIAGEESPAARAGLQSGDEIVALDGESVDRWKDVQDAVKRNAGRQLRLGIVRDDRRMEISVEPASDLQEGRTIGVIGVYPKEVLERVNPAVAVGRTFKEMGNLLVGFVRHVPVAFSPSSLGLSGDGPTNDRPFSLIGAGRFAAGLAAEGQVAIFLFLFVQINVFIAVFNLLPMPPLDGGHLLVLLIEKVRGKSVSPRALLPAMAVGFSLLLLLAMLLFYYDIVSPVQLPTP